LCHHACRQRDAQLCYCSRQNARRGIDREIRGNIDGSGGLVVGEAQLSQPGKAILNDTVVPGELSRIGGRARGLRDRPEPQRPAA